MVSPIICFLGTYPPIRCGIADYTSFLVGAMPPGTWNVISFDLHHGGFPLVSREWEPEPGVWFGLPSSLDFPAAMVRRGLVALGRSGDDSLLWFQHEFFIWRGDGAFVRMLRGLDMPKVVTMHTLHARSPETDSGMTRQEFEMLMALLPQVDGLTVFSLRAYAAVARAFPAHLGKVHVIRHGVHFYPEVCQMSTAEAKERLNDFLLYESTLDDGTKRALERERVLTDPDAVVVGQSGFLHPIKGDAGLFTFRDELQEMLPERRVVAVRIGMARRTVDEAHAALLRRLSDTSAHFLLEVFLPREMLPVAHRAFDVNYYWPEDASQSGMLPHAFGAGAIVAGRDMEGVGEALRDAGALYDTDRTRLTRKIRDLLMEPEQQREVRQMAVDYARRNSWERQAERHRDLAERVFSGGGAPENTRTSHLGV